MFDQAMVWNTDAQLQVTSLTARLRDFAGIGLDARAIHVGALWDDRDPFPVVAHHWCLGGESIAFEATVHDRRFQFELSPLFGPAGTPCGVTGRALEIAPIGETACSLLLVEIDGFKRLALERGYGFGSALLDTVEERLSRHVRPADSVSRLADGQYVVVLHGAASNDEALRAANTLLRSFDEPITTQTEAVRLTTSIGIATSSDFTSSGAMIGAAQREVDAVRRNGGNGIKCAIPCQVRSSPAKRRYAILGSA
jgi:diguanylate cyclase (GGDEF)-like protein